MSLEYRADVQILRGLAVLAVILFHSKATLIPQGYLGVDIFFVISGFVITPSIVRVFWGNRNKRLSKLRLFYKLRFFRLVPALYCTLLISILLMFIFTPTTDQLLFIKQATFTLILLGNYGAYKYSGDYFLPNPNPLVHT